MAKNKNKRKLKKENEETILLKKLPGLLALCEFILIPFLIVSPVASLEVIPELKSISEGEVQIAAVSEPVPTEVVHVTVTAYSSTKDQTDDTPFHTANGNKVRDGIVAANFLPLGTQLRIPEVFENKVFTVQDRMNGRYDQRIDIWMPSREQAKAFGIKHLKVEILPN